MFPVFMISTGLLYMFKSIVLIMIEDTSNSTRLAATKLPFRVEYGYRIDQYFYPIVIHCYLTVYSHVTATVAADTFYFALIQHACGMFSVVGHMLEHIGEDINENFNLKPHKMNDNDYNKAFSCLRKHLHVIKFAELIDSTFANIFLVSVSLNMIGGSICGIQVLMNLNDTKDIVAPLAIYVAQLTHLFFQFWQAQFLLDYSVVPYESICRANWYYTSERCKKLLLLIMSRTILPCRITAGKVATLSIESFGVLLYLLIAAADLDDVFSCTPSMWITIIFSFKLGWLIMNNKKLKTCLKTMEDDWLSLNTDVERNILQRHTAYGRYITLTYGIFMQFIGILLISKSVVMMLLEDTSDATISSLVAKAKLPLRVEYGEMLNQYLYPMAVHCYLAVFSHISITIAVDSCYIALIRHACGMFAIVGHTLEHIGKDSNDNFDLKPDKVKDDNYNRTLGCLRKHLHVIQFAELIESTFTNIFLVSVCLNMIGGSMIGIQVVLNLNDAKDIVEPFAIYIAQLIHLFLQFWPAQFLLDYSILPYESISLLPCKITAGKIVPLTIENFGRILYLLIGSVTLDDVFESLPSLIISILFSSKLLIIMLYSKKVSDEFSNLHWTFIRKSYNGKKYGICKDVEQNRRYAVLRLYLTISGLWPYYNLRNRCICFVPLFAFCSSIAIPQVYTFKKHDRFRNYMFYFIIPIQTLYLIGSITFDDVFESLPSLIISIIFSSKIMIIMLNSKKVKICLNTIRKDWLSANTDVERIILQRHTRYGQYLAVFYAAFMHVTSGLFIFKPIMLTLMTDDINATKSSIPFISRLPFRVEYGEKFNQYIYPITVHTYTAVFAHVFATIAVDGLYYCLIQHACGMFSIIGYTLENIGKNNDDIFDAKQTKIQDSNYNKTLYCLRRHLLVIEFAEHIESLFTKIFLINLNLNMIIGSLTGIQVLMNLDKSARDIAGPITMYLAQFLHLFLHFWQAQFLLDYSILPYKSICRANWYDASRRCQKLLLLIMNRTTSPCKITAGKIVILSIESFATVSVKLYCYILYLLIGSITLDDVFECVPPIFISITFSSKLLFIMLNSEKVKACLNIIQKDWQSLNSVEKVILERHSKYGQHLATFYAVLMHTTASLFVVKPIMLTLIADDIINITKSSIPFESRLPFRVEYGKKFNQYIYPIAVHSYVAVIAHSFATVVADALYYTLIQHACGMFSIIGNTLENIGKNNEENFDAKPIKVKDDNYSKTLHCLRRHIIVIEFAEYIESLFTKIFLMTLNFNMIGISITGIQLLMHLNKGANDIIGPLTICIALFIHLFLHFWQGQFLLDYSVLPYESICRANWYYTSQRCRKLLLLMMYRTVIPCKITAGKLMILSIDNFATVVKTSLSYLTVFRSMQ
ncbi:Putative odorant receptor 13a [Trachymyrmex septentrionalis]|nr:Putative odorant receptor 13a [Trachymyrmex septentrionalis]